MKIAASIILAIAGVLIADKINLAFGVTLIAVGYLISSYNIIHAALKGVFKGHFLDENFLMVVASVGAFILGEYFEALAVLILFKVGEMFEEYAEERSRRSIEALSELTEESAHVIRGGEEVAIPTGEVKAGDMVYVYPGGRIAFDGVVTAGVSTADTSAITGESIPREIRPGDEVYSGFINVSARISMKVTRPACESTVSRILKLVESASERKSRHESFIRRFAKIYTPAVVAFAVLLAIVPIFFGFDAKESVYRALSFLVVSCPCALVVSVPLAIFCGIGKASRDGILIKGGSALEALSYAKVAVFDKTGTLTEGHFSISEIRSSIPEDEFLALAASAERYSTHPIAVCITEEAKKRGLTLYEASEVVEVAGKGVKALIDGREICIGNATLIGKERGSGAEVYVTAGGEAIGHIRLSDKVKPGAKEALSAIRNLGVKRCIIFTGDGEENALSVADEVSADEVRHSLLPEGKASALEEVKSSLEKGEKVIFTGDGINDAPVLACADVGISAGDFASDAAIEASDVILLGNGGCDIAKLKDAIILSRRVMRTVKVNVFASILIKISVLILCSFGILGMWAAIFADVGVLILAILNSLRV